VNYNRIKPWVNKPGLAYPIAKPNPLDNVVMMIICTSRREIAELKM